MEPLAEIPTEITLLGWGVVLLLVQLVLQGVAGVSELGVPYALGPRDDRRELRKHVQGRLARAFYNMLETFPVFAALALAVTLTGRGGGISALGAHLWLWGRVAYVPLYAFGIPGLRTVAWAVSLAGIILMLIALLT